MSRAIQMTDEYVPPLRSLRGHILSDEQMQELQRKIINEAIVQPFVNSLFDTQWRDRTMLLHGGQLLRIGGPTSQQWLGVDHAAGPDETILTEINEDGELEVVEANPLAGHYIPTGQAGREFVESMTPRAGADVRRALGPMWPNEYDEEDI